MRVALLASMLLLSCGGLPPGQFQPVPNATLAPPVTKVSPEPGVFNGELKLIFTTDFPATVFVSTDGSDPRTTSAGRVSGKSPFEVVIKATSTVKYFASRDGKDEELQLGTWTRAGGPKGTISGVVVVGNIAVGTKVGIFRNAEAKQLGKPAVEAEIPFKFEGLMSGAHRLQAISDRDGDGNLVPLVDYQSDVTTITLDLNDPFKAAAENVKIYLGTSSPELATLKGTITLPKPPAGQSLSLSALQADGFTSIDPQALLTQLQNGYRIFTNNVDTAYPYVITDLNPGRYVPVPVLLGFGAGGVAMNFIANPLKPATLKAGETTIADFAYGPITLSGNVTVKPSVPTMGNVVFAVVAARNTSLLNGIQGVLMPAVLVRDPMTMELKGAFAGEALRSNSTFQVRAFVGTSATSNALTDALLWAINPLAAQPAQATVNTGMADTTVDVVVQ